MTGDQQLLAALGRLEKVCDKRPELRMLGEINTQLLRTLFAANTPGPSESDLPQGANRLAEGIPLLHSAPLPLDDAMLRCRWLDVCRILSANDPHASADPLAKGVAAGSLSVAEQLGSVLSGAPDRCRDQLLSLGLDVALGFTVLRLCSLPLLAPIARRLDPQLQQHRWNCGYCPICGSEPLLAELRGLEQLRWLRCGWCAANWQVDRLHCPSCGNREHHQLRDLLVEGQEQAYRLSICDACGNSLPTIATLTPLSPPALLVAEMETLHLRIVAVSLRDARP